MGGKHILPFVLALLAASIFVLISAPLWADENSAHEGGDRRHHGDDAIQLGPRPFFLVKGMDEGPLKQKLLSCQNGPFRRTNFSIAHRGAPLQFPEHTREAYEAGARMGAGIVECDVTFTKDGALVCRHDECDLHTTTNIVATELNNSCTVPYAGPGSAPRCCTSDITLAQFKTLRGKMDASNPNAQDAAGFLGGTATFRTDLYTSRGTLLTLRESIALNRKLGVKHTPELKAGNPDRIRAVFGSQANYAQKMIDEFKRAGVHPRDVFAQSFNLDDVLYWIRNEPHFGRQAVYLDDVDPGANIPPLTAEELRQVRAQGVRIFAPPIPALLAVNELDEIVPSRYALDIRRAGLKIITWSFERSDLRNGAGAAGFYWAFDPHSRAVKKDSDMYEALDVLARDVDILGIFSDWPATVSYYASCMDLD
jgi:glycerophosphoryl diester phosphodiesterase